MSKIIEEFVEVNIKLHKLFDIPPSDEYLYYNCTDMYWYTTNHEMLYARKAIELINDTGNYYCYDIYNTFENADNNITGVVIDRHTSIIAIFDNNKKVEVNNE